MDAAEVRQFSGRCGATMRPAVDRATHELLVVVIVPHVAYPSSFGGFGTMQAEEGAVNEDPALVTSRRASVCVRKRKHHQPRGVLFASRRFFRSRDPPLFNIAFPGVLVFLNSNSRSSRLLSRSLARVAGS